MPTAKHRSPARRPSYRKVLSRPAAKAGAADTICHTVPGQGLAAGSDRMHIASQQNRMLVIALGASLAVHALALAVRFVDPELLRLRSTDPALEVILVNARSPARPSQPEAYAQANLDGGGANDAGRRSSPLPNLMQQRDGEALEQAQARAERAAQQPPRLASLDNGELTVSTAERPAPAVPALAGTADSTADVLARMQAEISKRISDYQKRPRRHHFMPSTSEYRYARYVEDWRGWVERIGNEHYPEEARGRLYGALRMTVVIGADGRLVQAVIEESSGSAVLDRAARHIVKLAAPFPPFPPEIARDTDMLEITRTWIFTNDKFATRGGDRPAAP